MVLFCMASTHPLASPCSRYPNIMKFALLTTLFAAASAFQTAPVAKTNSALNAGKWGSTPTTTYFSNWMGT